MSDVKAGRGIKLSEFDTAITEIMGDFIGASYEVRQEALKAGAAVMVEKLKVASPNGEGGFANNWEVKEYKDAHYIHNTTLVATPGTRKGKKKAKRVRTGIPLANILEYKTNQRHYGFIQRTATAAESEVLNTIKTKLNGGK